MGRKKIDNRIRMIIENGVNSGHRTMFVIVGDKSKDQVVILHHMLSKAAVKARPTVLWCYKKELGFTSHRKKRMKEIQRKIKAGKLNVNEDDPFELFIASTEIRYCYYTETQKILGNTYGMCVLQDFEALTPNLLARTIETVEGGGLIVILLRSLSSLKQLYTLTMDVHDRYRTEAHNDVVGRFNERFLLSLSSCKRCLVVNDELIVLPISSHVLTINKDSVKTELTGRDKELVELKESLKDTEVINVLLNCCKTLDQSKAVLKFIEAITEKTLRSTVSLTASRGRGKSAALGLAVAAAVAFGYANIFVTSPSPENLKTFFEFVFKGFKVLQYQEHLDYGLVQSTNPEYNKALIRVNVFRNNRQTIQYIHPTDANKLSQAELLVIDEAAAIPLPYVKSMFGPYLVFLSSTINGYEGTGRSLSLKLLQQLRNQSSSFGEKSLSGRTLDEITLEESIRYKPGDSVEQWLTDLLCLDATSVQPSFSGTPSLNECDLYYINRDTLFCYHKASESFLHKIVALFVSSHYKNSPNDLQMMSDAPGHHLFCLLGPVNPNQKHLPEVLCVIQVCLEGELSKDFVNNAVARSKRPSGDLIPWTMAQQFQDEEFPSLAGVRVVRIATHPDYQSMGYGSKALSLLKAYYSLQIPSLDNITIAEKSNDKNKSDDETDLYNEDIAPREGLPPLLLKLSERPPEKLDYIGVSYGLTLNLLKFWKKADFVPVYLRQTTNELTGEHSCIMLYPIEENSSWLNEFSSDFRRRFLSLLSYQFAKFTSSLAFSILTSNKLLNNDELTNDELDIHFTKFDLKRLELYCNNLVDYHLIMDLNPIISRLFFLSKLGSLHLSPVQSTILIGIGLQHKRVDDLSKELDLPSTQLLALYNRSMRKLHQYLTKITESAIEEKLGLTSKINQSSNLPNIKQSMVEELDKDEKIMKAKQAKELNKLKKEYLAEYEIKGTDEDWEKALQTTGKQSVISVKSGERKPVENQDIDVVPPKKKKKKQKQF